MSRSESVRQGRGRTMDRELADRGTIALARGRHGLDEEQPAAYKDVNDVVNVVDQGALSQKFLRLRPLDVIKG